jgi:hypothetical protein
MRKIIVGAMVSMDGVMDGGWGTAAPSIVAVSQEHALHVGLGLTIGVAGAVAMGRVLRGVLVQTNALDAFTEPLAFALHALPAGDLTFAGRIERGAADLDLTTIPEPQDRMPRNFQ